MRVAILSNDVIPGMGLPVAAPGIRAWGMAEGLRALGHEVTILLDPWLVGTVWASPIPAPVPRGAMLLKPNRIPDFVRAQRVEVLVVCNSNHVGSIGDLGDCRLIYDFFAPKMLELAENTAREDLDQALATLEERKLAALARSDAVAVNGAKKLPYVQEWLERAGVADLPRAVVNPGVPPLTTRPPEGGPLRVVVSGYLQPWSRPGAWASAVLPLLDEGVIRLDLLVARHWGQRKTTEPIPGELHKLFEHPGVVRHGAMRLGDLRRLLAGCHLSIDVFARNPERELAMVTRSVVALASGLPVMHVPFTEVSPWIEEHGAGWLVEDDDATAIGETLRAIAADRSEHQRARSGAEAVSREVLDPVVAARPLAELMEEVR